MWPQLILWIVTSIISYLLQPKPKGPQPGKFDVPTVEEGVPIGVLFGSGWIPSPIVAWWGNTRNVAIKKGGGLFTKAQIVGWKYYMGQHQVYAMSPSDWPIEQVSRIRVGEQTVWTGSVTANGTIAINAPNAFGGESSEGGISGNVDILFGGATQGVNAYLNAKLTGFPLPAFRGVFSLVLNQVYLAANNPYIKPWAIYAKRNVSPWYSAKSAIGEDINAVHVIYDCLTNTRYGRRISAGLVDDVAFRAAADTVYAEGIGISIFWQDDQSSIEDFIQRMADIINASVYVDQTIKKWTITLARDDYTIGTLPIFDASNIVEVEDFAQPLLGDLISEVELNYIDRETGKPGAVKDHDIAVLSLQGGRPNKAQVDMPAVPTADLATLLLGRELRERSAPLATATLIVNRDAWNVNIGDVFRWQWPAYGIVDMVMRVGSVGRGKLADNKITIKCITDIFAVAKALYAVPASSGWTSPLTAPAPLSHRRVIEAPYWVVVHDLIGDSATLIGEVAATDGYLLAMAARQTGNEYDFDLLTRLSPSGTYDDRGAGELCPYAELAAAAVAENSSTWTLVNGIDLDLVEVDTWAEIEGELVKVKSSPGGTVTVARGVLDTVPVSHAIGAKIYFGDRRNVLDPSTWSNGNTVNAKILPRTGLGMLDESLATADNVVMGSRFKRPYPPGNFKANGLSYPSALTGDLTFTWAHRDKAQQNSSIVEQTDASIGPEAGQTYTIRIYNAQTGGTLIRTYSGLTGSSQIYTAVLATADNGGSLPSNIRVEIESVNGSLTSWQHHTIKSTWS